VRAAFISEAFALNNIIMIEDCKASQKKSLMNSLETLNYRAKTLSDLAEMSNRLVRKFTNPMPQPECESFCDEPKSLKDGNPDLIDLFNIVADNMQREIIIIDNNITKLFSIID